LRYELHARFTNLGQSFADLAGQGAGQNVIDLSDVPERILAGGRLERHRAAGGNEAVQPVAAADLAIVSHLGAQAAHREIKPGLGGGLRVVQRIDDDARAGRGACAQVLGDRMLDLAVARG